MGNRVTELFCWIAYDPADDNEGIPAAPTVMDGERYFIPLMGADMDRVASLRRHVEAVKAAMPSDCPPFKLRRFVITEEVVDEL